jgi:glucose-6-phosphate 1-dehydrogenase
MTTLPPLAPCDFVVFGGTGDLSMRKLHPALFLRDRDGQLAADTRILSVSRSGLDDADFRAKVRGELGQFVPSGELDQQSLDRFLARVKHLTLDVIDTPAWSALASLLQGREDRVRVFYLACSSSLFGTIADQLQELGLVTEKSRVVLEKPIGSDLASAREVNDAVGRVFDESQIFRIDHYLGKESVQNLLVTRFSNVFLEPLWNRTWIDHVQITAAETIGVGGRGGYYDGYGALRDMVQNHLLQLLCLVAMEPPTYVDRETVRDEKLKVLKALRPITSNETLAHTVTGQYVAGLVDGSAVPPYLDDIDATQSSTETFVALRTYVDNWRWAGVPFYLRTGKRLARRCSEIVVTFKPVPHPMFPGSEGHGAPNQLVIQLQPDEGMRLQILAKEPGPGGIRLRPVFLDLNYAASFDKPSPEAYERLLLDVVRGNPTLFMRRDEVETAWAWVEPILDDWAGTGRKPASYAAGTTGPTPATSLIERDGRSWHEGTTS